MRRAKRVQTCEHEHPLEFWICFYQNVFKQYIALDHRDTFKKEKYFQDLNLLITSELAVISRLKYVPML